MTKLKAVAKIRVVDAKLNKEENVLVFQQPIKSGIRIGDAIRILSSKKSDSTDTDTRFTYGIGKVKAITEKNVKVSIPEVASIENYKFYAELPSSSSVKKGETIFERIHGKTR